MQCLVYWLHLEEHTDVFSQGYIGITTQGLPKRFAQHKSLAKSGKGITVGRALRKYDNKVIATELIASDVDTCLMLEFNLRPNSNIAWNYSAGGGSRVDLGHNAESRKKISESLVKSFKLNPRSPRKNSEETKAKMSLSAKGRMPSQKTLDGWQNFSKGQDSWEKSNADKTFWKRAQEFYEFWSISEKVGLKFLENKFGLVSSKFQVIVKKFKSDWIPENDPKWVVWASAN